MKIATLTIFFATFIVIHAYPNQPISTRDTMNRLHWTHRTKKSDPETELGTDQTQDMMLLNVLSGEIIGDLQGILANIKSAENVHRQQQQRLERILVNALKTMNMDPADPDRLLRLS